MNEKLYSSTSSGYLILPRLKDSTYNFTIGFPGNQFPEQKFSCPIGKKDHGYLVKNFGDKGWGLIDLQTQSVQMAENDSKKDVSMINMPVNAFTDLLAKAADDSTLRQKIVLHDEKKPEAVVQAPVVKEIRKDSVITAGNAKTGASAQANASNESLKRGAKKDSVAVPVSSAGSETTGQANLPAETSKKETTNSIDTAAKSTPVKKEDTVSRLTDMKSGKADTGIQKESKIPGVLGNETQLQRPVFAKSKVARTGGVSTTQGFDLTFTDTYPDGKQEVIKIMIPDDKTLISNQPSKDTVQKKVENPAQENNAKTIAKNNCRQVASDADFYKLRKKMASGKSDASMLLEANKVFRIKCFTSLQIKNLSSLFLGDGGKYSFFDAAYAHTSDTENFPALQSELKDEYFINRFKAMLR